MNYLALVVFKITGAFYMPLHRHQLNIHKFISMPLLQSVHHIAIICSNYERSKQFYTEILELTVIREVYRSERQSWKLDLALNDQYIIELFSFPNPAERPSRPEACGLRHLAFAVQNLEQAKEKLEEKGITVEPIRTDEFTQKKFTFFADPDGLPIEIYEV